MTNTSPEIRQAELALRDGKLESIFSIAKHSISSGTPGIEWVRFALSCRDNGALDASKQLLYAVIESEPENESGYYELAFIHRLKGEHREAVSVLRNALRTCEVSVRTRIFLGHMLYAVGAHFDANEILVHTRASSERESIELDNMFAFGHYISKYPLGRALVMLDFLKTSCHWLETSALAEKIMASVISRRPFSLVRLGDGEGGMLTIDSKDEYLHRSLYDRNREELIAMWFGSNFPWKTNGFIDMAGGIFNSIEDNDVVGIPYESWLRHEYSISSLRGIPSLLNIYRYIILSKRNLTICSQNAHVDLYINGDLEKIILHARVISVISCLEELPELLKNKFNLDEVKFYRIPGEQGSRQILGEKTVDGEHYPGEFHRLQAELSQPHNGRLFLVAGGILGKFYATTIRRHGGIALDIGSIVDAWTGRATRPGYVGNEALKL